MIAVTTILITTWCWQHNGASNNSASNPQQESISIGVIAPLSGPGAVFGEDVIHGLTYMQQKINNAWWIRGKRVELIIEDGKCSGKDAVSAVNKLINVDNVQAILGWVCSSETLAAGKIAQQNGIPMIAALSSSATISSVWEYVFRYRNDADAGNTLVNHIEANWSESIALIYEINDYGAAYANVIKEAFDGNIILEDKFSADEKDFSILAKKVIAIEDQIDHVIYIPQSEASTLPFVKSLDDLWDWESLSKKFVWTDTIITQSMVSTLGDLWENLQGVSLPSIQQLWWDATTATQEIIAWYDVQSTEVFILLAADSFLLLQQAIEAVGYDSNAIQRYLIAVNNDNRRESLFGRMRFDEKGDGQWLPFSVMEVKNWELVTY